MCLVGAETGTRVLVGDAELSLGHTAFGLSLAFQGGVIQWAASRGRQSSGSTGGGTGSCLCPSVLQAMSQLILSKGSGAGSHNGAAANTCLQSG